jgi:hypothetical protein
MVDITKTRTQLIHRALAAIGALEPGESPSTEDYNTMDNLVDPLIEMLAADEIIYVIDSEEIPVEFFIPLANLLGNLAGPDFGSPVNDDAKARDEAFLKRINSTRPTYAAQQGNYY